MKILLIRHAKAEEPSGVMGFGQADRERELTATGRQEMRRVAKGLRKITPDLDVVASSPLVRARQTAKIVSKVFGSPKPVEIESLSPGGSQTDLLTWLAEHPRTSAVALVGHEPDLGEWLGLMLTGKSRGFAEFKKGSCALVEFEDKAEAGEGTLLWLLAPGQLRKLA